MQNIEYIITDHSGLDQIRTLWEELNKHHHSYSKHFKERYNSFTFETRKEALLKKIVDGEIRVEIAFDKNKKKNIGYSISSVTGKIEKEGEIDSIFIDPGYRGLGIGETLMKHGIQWLDKHNTKTRKIIVAAGNENVFSYYEKFGFYHKFSILEPK